VVSASRILEELLVFGSNLGVVLMKRPCLVTAIMLAASIAQAGDISSSFTNLDFDSGVTHIATGFDAMGQDVAGWTNANGGNLVDSGVEGPAAWWIDDAYPNFQAAFMRTGDAAFNLSTHVIQAGDVFEVKWNSHHWNWEGPSAWTATLFYDTPANVIGTFTESPLANSGAWALFTSPTIAATPASVGGMLGIHLTNSGDSSQNRHAQVDEITVHVIPEPATFGLAGVCGAALLAFRRRAAC
jgi:hypothetical protein